MRGFVLPLVALFLAVLLCMGHEAQENDDFIEDYFYIEEIEIVKSAPVVEGLPAGLVELNHSHLQPYMDLITSRSRAQPVLVFLSTSQEARQAYEGAVKTIQKRDGADIYLFTVPLVSSDDAFEVTFKDAHKIVELPTAGLHILAFFPVPNQFGMQIARENARLVDPGVLSAAEWNEKLTSMIRDLTTPPPPEKPASESSLPMIFTVGLGLYFVVVLLPRLYEARDYLLPYFRSKSTWFMICVFVMYLALSGTFFTIIHGSPLFYLNSNGFALMHPSSQRQFALEGWTLGALPLVASAVLIAVSEAMPYILGPDNRFHAATMLLLGFAFLCFFEHVLFTSKNRWYRLF
ncbi:hypothetical protein ACHHYP_08793 [Achlya hypogyna]|uniref:Uncharacterized protein n=1 Tax=Achlya hypogyna TaxID=1202772 RepID=A0A1V9YNY8_ACHHY|nr:hypothetical protein ACHHYP_08793 [Achlya hypogyna]